MREIKFRFFSERDSQMGKKGMWEDTHAASEGEGLNELIESLMRMGMKIMQYTGLKDKNDKEIYEGDIVSDPESCYPANVIFIDGIFMAEWAEECEYLRDVFNAEVIGNIYENPDIAV